MTLDPRLHRIVAAQPHPLLFATISGAHLYGFPSPDSDFDLRGAHILPLEKIVGLEIHEETIEQSMIVPPDGENTVAQAFQPAGSGDFPVASSEDALEPETGSRASACGSPEPTGRKACATSVGALEMDIVSHDVKKFFGLLLKKNGYVLEQLYSPLIVHTTPEHDELKVICNPRQFDTSPNPLPGRGGEGVITKHHAHHYFGFAETQWKLFDKERPRRVKPLLYVYRVLLTGIHLMRTGQIEANLATLNETEFRLPYIPDLIARKLASPEKSKLEDADMAFHGAEYHRLRAELQSAHDASQLRETPSDQTRAALNDLLIRLRLKNRSAGL